jgi:nucleoside-diphosphate-sugar epimerase
VLNVGTGQPTTVAQLAAHAGRLRDPPLEPVYEETAEGEFSKLVPDKKRNAAELKTMLLNVDRARRTLGWQPATTLAEGLQREYAWAADNLQRWESIRYTVV